MTTKKNKLSARETKALAEQGLSLNDLIEGKKETVAKAVAAHSKKQTTTTEAKSAKEKKSKATPKKAEKKPKSGALIKELLMKGMDTEKVLAAVYKAFPDSKATTADVSWHRWDLKKKGMKVPAAL